MEVDGRHQRLRQKIASLEQELDDLKSLLTTDVQSSAGEASSTPHVNGGRAADADSSSSSSNTINGASAPSLALEDYKRYGRQMIMPEIGLRGQLRLKDSRVLVIGLGGLGCPAAMYLAGAGVGTMGLMDGDSVELSNLHRQLLHTNGRIGMNKATSAAIGLQAINPSLKYQPFPHNVTSSSLSDIEQQYDLLLDCTDNPASRYLISDLAVAAGIPLISASAMKTDGQLLILNNPPVHDRTSDHRSRIEGSGFCYRCVFPRPPPPETVLSCGESGILGPVVGVMGTLMAVESIKLLSKKHKERVLGDEGKRMLLYSAWGDPPFRTVKLKGKRAGCETCSHPRDKIRADFHRGAIDYVQFCGSKSQADDHDIQRMSASQYADIPSANKNYLIDVRSVTEYEIAHVRESVILPLAEIQQNPAKKLRPFLKMGGDLKQPVVFICRYGNDSQEAVRLARREAALLNEVSGGQLAAEPCDIKGGLKAWREQVDPDFPEY
ncbi:MAG: hypothetical protein OHK93_005297 [Ramalina farinacea]|uniref:Adenylyltransferase and sulfurtransferase uba4 n=1 Tax=Ramalina farinacea TaxID=258253 RepID=A0AA43QWD1_9LECA|nr:hypothetical protein [Ramalina farinacea]